MNTSISVASLVSLANVERLSSRVVRILGQNPGPFTLQGTNTYLVGRGARRALIDTGEGKPEYASLLASVLQNEKAAVSSVYITHHHHDHIGGIPSVLDSSPSPISLYKYLDAKMDTDSLHQYSPVADKAAFPIDDTTEPASTTTLEVVYSPGHTKDHIAFYLPEENAIFTGDCVLGQGTTVFNDLRLYLASVAKLRDLNASRLYPGHGPIIDGSDNVRHLLETYISHRQEREDQIKQVLSASGAGGTTAERIVEAVYGSELDARVRFAAEGGVLLHLRKLLEEGAVVLGPAEDMAKVGKAVKEQNLAMLRKVIWVVAAAKM